MGSLRLLLVLLMSLVGLSLRATPSAFAAGMVDNGTPESCTEAALDALAGLTLTATMTTTATHTPTRTATPTAPQMPTRTPPPWVHIQIGAERGVPGGTVTLSVWFTASVLSVAATGNNISFDPSVLNLGPSDCQVNPNIGKSLVISVIEDTASRRTLRFFVRPGDPDFIPNGDLYSCTARIADSALPGTYRLSLSNVVAFDPLWVPLDAGSWDGLVIVDCVGDCDRNHSVTVADILTSVNVALGNTPVTSCEAGDADHNSQITVNEILAAVNNALTDCQLAPAEQR